MLRYDILARTIENPKDFKSDRLDPENYLMFQEVGRNNDYALSVASRFQLASDYQVHEYGHGVVATKNERHRSQKGAYPDPMKRYVGFYDFYAKTVLDLNLACYRVSVKYRPEQGQTAHFQVELYSNGHGTKNEKRDCRRSVREAMIDNLFGPTICPTAQADEALAGPLSGLVVKAMPPKEAFSG